MVAGGSWDSARIRRWSRYKKMNKQNEREKNWSSTINKQTVKKTNKQKTGVAEVAQVGADPMHESVDGADKKKRTNKTKKQNEKENEPVQLNNCLKRPKPNPNS